ncbi:Phosphatidate phosphatase LPIN3 [Hondaea fermentalgiana]|uniref:Phosphatidate phosphatase LPIN3 n=1 Tax=Hondaea fermentalgiana TaxID=2315210 RepID=A0A2R5G6Z4_9STRA|nr:Phosphatidate phosphatase LPIN3 [Hondaea fermentalgiana]|eukprot:GBG24223.1 Phosphatidate phosphatase LPIN3 [Hondaea fermentalgiana]
MPANAPMHQEQRQYSSQPILRRNGYATDVVGVRSKDTGEIFTTNFNVRFTGRSGKFEARGDTVDVLLDDRVRFTMEIGDGGKAQFPSGKLAPDPEVLGNVTSLLDELGPHKLKFEHRYTANGEYRLNYVEALFWLWDSSDSIVVSDIDGTITRSDVGGMINGVLGARMGWKKGHAHPGVCFLYNHLIDETNAHIMYLTARPLNLINDTRSYIYELEQPVSSSSMTMRQLPPGPIITDTTNLTSSFRREVVDRSSHVFKTEMLSQLRDCFTNAGRDIRRYPVFLATFGNKDTDAVAYRAVGAPPVTIFIIGTDSRVQVADEFRERWTNYSDPRLVKVIMERIDLIKSGRLPDPNLPID